ncbi:hypothetical protein GCM10028774_01610 [Spirosoma jeollabukense]
MLPDLLPVLVWPWPELLPLDWLPTLPTPDDELLAAELPVDPLFWPVVPDVPVWPERLAEPDWLLPVPVVPWEEALPDLELLDWA